jgi:hypothetical protein
MRSAIAAFALVCFVQSLQGADDDNPYRKAKIGDWVSYKMTGKNMEGTTKMTVVSKDDKEVTFEVASIYSFMGKEQVAPVQTMKIDLTKSYDAISAANLKANNVKIEKLDEGKEKIKAAGKEFETKWTNLRATTKVGEQAIVTEYTMWFSKDVPLSGLVRMDTTSGEVTTRLDLTGTGSK